jgi:putative exporter of polyketide antibiotics
VLLILVALDQVTVANAVFQFAVTSACAGAFFGAIAALQAWLSRQASRDG